jgi:hypothetical protein
MAKRDKRDDKCFWLPKDADEAHSLAEDARGLWKNRDIRMQRDQWAYELRRSPAQKGEVRESIADAAVQMEAADDLMSSVDMQLNIATDDQLDEDIAQQAEDLGRHIWEEWRKRYARQGRPPLIVDFCHTLNQYGWLCPRLLLNPHDTRFPWTMELLDPRRIYLDKPDGTPDVIVYYTQLAPRQIARQFGVRTLHKVLPDAEVDDTIPVDVIQYHTDHEMAVSINSEWLKPPTEHEYHRNPVFVLMAGGTTFRGPLPSGDLRQPDAQTFDVEDWDARVGTSFIQSMIPVLEDGQKIADLRAELLAQTARPPTVDKLRTTELNKPISGAGAWARLTPDEGHEQHPPPAQGLQYVIQLSQERANAIAMLGLNPAILGGGEAQASFDRFLLSAAGARTLRKRMDTLEMAIALLIEAALDFYAEYGGPPVRYVTTDRATGGRKLVQKLRPEHLRAAQLHVTCRFGEIGVPDLQGRMTVAGMGVREGLISQNYALSEILRVQNPAQVMAEASRDQCWKIPQFVQMMALAEMAKNPVNPIAGAIAMELLPASAARLAELAKPPQPPGPAPGGPPPGGPPGLPAQQPPLPGSQMPSTPQIGVPPQIQPPPVGNPAAGPNGPLPPGMMPPGAAMPALR